MQNKELVELTEEIQKKLLIKMKKNQTILLSFICGGIDIILHMKIEDCNIKESTVTLDGECNRIKFNLTEVVHISKQEEIDGIFYDLRLDNGNIITLLL